MHRSLPHAPRQRARRTWLGHALATGALVAAPALRAQARRVRLRLLLNTSVSSPQAWLWLAQERGYLEREGIELDLTPGTRRLHRGAACHRGPSRPGLWRRELARRRAGPPP